MTEQSRVSERLTHLDDSGNIQMVDVTGKAETTREAIAKARVRMAAHTVRLIESNQITKGSVLEVAKIAAIMAAKQTPQLIPLCHPLPMTHIDVQFTLDSSQGIIQIEARTRTNNCSGRGVGSGTSVSRSTSGPPGVVKVMARMLSVSRLNRRCFRECAVAFLPSRSAL